MLLDREAVRAVGGWDERFYPAVFMDIDMSTAMWNHGRLVLSVPASGVRHQSGALGRRQSTALTGPLLARFLFERHRDRFISKWGAAVRGLAPPPADEEPASIRAAVRAALPRTRERAELIRSGGWRPAGPPARAEHPLTGIPEPVLDAEDGTHTVAAEVDEALDAAELQVVDEYCRWLIAEEKSKTVELWDARMQLQHRDLELADVRRQIEALQSQNQELALTLDRIVHGLTWRVRTMIHRIARAPLALLRRARRG
jgi:hypothetical protein